MMPSPFGPGAIFPAQAAMLPRGPPQFAPAYPPIFYWPYPSPPVSPTNYYNPAGVGAIAPIPQQAALLTSPECLHLGQLEPRVQDAHVPRSDVDKRVPLPPLQAPRSQYIELFMV